MSDGKITINHAKSWGYKPKGSTEIVAPGALR
jgi:hypothetical protein